MMSAIMNFRLAILLVTLAFASALPAAPILRPAGPGCGLQNQGRGISAIGHHGIDGLPH